MFEGTIIVKGKIGQKGSKRAFVRGHRAVLVDDNSKLTKLYEACIREEAARVVEGMNIDLLLPVVLRIQLLFARPKCHYNRKGLKPDAPVFVTRKPDLDKTERAILDSLTGLVYRDDAQVVHVEKFKAYAEEESTTIHFRSIEQNRHAGEFWGFRTTANSSRLLESV